MSLMYNCREIVDLVSRELDEELSPWIKLRMTVHLSMCGHCRTYRSQIRHVEKLIQEHFSGDWESAVPGLSEEAKKRIEESLLNK